MSESGNVLSVIVFSFAIIFLVLGLGKLFTDGNPYLVISLIGLTMLIISIIHVKLIRIEKRIEKIVEQ